MGPQARKDRRRAMGWITGTAVYLCIWWIVIFAVLPWGVRAAGPNENGFDPGAPENPHLKLKLVATTVIAGAIWLGVHHLVNSSLFSFRDWLPMGLS